MSLPADRFYLGKEFDLAKSQVLEKQVLYDPADLTTHGVIVGMTGSGKTGLGIALLEEAALQGIPALLVDPKGDITNLLLHFPDLSPADFAPWIDPEQARRDGKTADQAAADASALWKKGLADWGIAPERVRALSSAAQYAVYTPGSEAGLPVNILASLQAPAGPWDSNREALREKISGTVTAILGLVGITDLDPLRSREHILLSNLLENAWSKGQGMDLAGLILQTQSPPIAKLGVFDVESFYPARERQELAVRLNSVLAAPSFQAWVTGEPLDIASLLRAPDGRPRQSVFTIAHLSDAERMFFVTLLLTAAEGWMRTQQGTGNLRAILYFDELYGYLPPVANPPCKTVFLRMLKQARAFGLGLLLATQNPVDLDYKALSNAGTWFIGKLQTDQDKQRLLDGLETPGIDRATLDKTISRLGKRIFLLHNTHAKAPVIFQTRWAMNFLAGPLTRAQIPALNALVGAKATASAGTTVAVQSAGAPIGAPAAAGAARPGIPQGIAEFFLPQNLPLAQACAAAGKPAAESAAVVYRPALLGQASVRYLDRKIGIDRMEKRTVLALSPDRRGVVRWEDYPAAGVEEAAIHQAPAAGEFGVLDAPLNDAKLMRALEKDFLDWAYRGSALRVLSNPALGVTGEPGMTAEEFARRCEAALAAGGAKLTAPADKKLRTLRERLAREERELQQDQTEMTQRTIEEVGTAADNLFGMLTGRSRRLTTSLTKRRMTARAAGDVDESKKTIEELKAQIAQLEKERTEALAGVSGQTQEITLAPAKKDVYVELFGVAWVPCYRLSDGSEIAGYKRG